MVIPRSRSRSMESSTCAIISRSEKSARKFKEAIGKCGLAVVYMRNDAEVTD